AEDGAGPEDRRPRLRALHLGERLARPLAEAKPATAVSVSLAASCPPPSPSLEPHAVRVAVLVVALVPVAVARRDTGLAHDDHTGRATVDAEPATGAHVLVDYEHHVLVGVDAGLDRVERLGDRVGAEHVDALPRADVDTALAHDALGLVDVEELLRLHRLAEVVGRDLLQDVLAGKRGHRRVGVGLGHVRPSSPEDG